MEEFLKGAMLGMVAGVCVGACIVAKNKKLASKLKSGLETAEVKMKEVKEDLQEKIDKDCKSCDCDYTSSENNQNQCGEQGQKDFSKKNKN
ncbi:MAG: hypothetical protein J6J33_02035 [Clostridia bacterium]|nr:hypothetical protein [Clostridia bacterium]